MEALKNRLAELTRYLSGEPRQTVATTLFFKGLLLVTLFKMVGLWAVSRTVMKYHEITLPGSLPGKILLGPAFLAAANIDLFYVIGLIFLVVALAVKPNYFVTSAFFWLTFNLYVVNLPFANGADLVLFMLALWCIPLPVNAPAMLSGGTVIRQTAHNLAVVMCKLQIVIIYLVSGLDKLLSETWRSGVAFDYIVHLDTMYHPAFSSAFDSPAFQVMLSWSTIGFELLFVVLVWIDRSRLLMLAAGICFHLFIAIVLTLPDFAAVMIASYIIFLTDHDIAHIKRIFKR